MELKGRVAIVTGGSRGIGRGIVLALTRAGAEVAFCYAKEEGEAKVTMTQVEALGKKCLDFRADVTDYENMSGMVSRVVATFGGVDILVNNAGIPGSERYVADEDFENVRRVIETNIFGSFHITRLVLPHMRKRRRGDIHFISSTRTLTFRAGSAAYTIAKAGVEALAKCLAKEELLNNIRVNIITPGSIETEHLIEEWHQRNPGKKMNDLYASMPFGRLGKPEDIGNLVVFLASDKGSWISGHSIYVDGGASGYTVPRLLSYE